MQGDTAVDEIDWVKLPVSAIMDHLAKKRWTDPQIAKKIGVTPLQVFYYRNGKTKSPKPNVCKSILDNIKVDGKRALVNTYRSVEELEEHYELWREQNEH